jgi:hypothetical protein
MDGGCIAEERLRRRLCVRVRQSSQGCVHLLEALPG